MKRKFIIAGVFLFIAGILFLYRYNYIPHRKYPDAYFGINRYISNADKDNDGIDDQTDILKNARSYLNTKPKYKSKYYSSGYPDDDYGVCTDVVSFALLGAGYDLRELMNTDIEQFPEDYGIENPDKNIDFRRVTNMKIYFEKHAVSLTTDTKEKEEWQPGDIVIWKKHVGIISDARNAAGIPFVLHNASPYQASYEEDILCIWGKITGHYRIS